MASTDRASPPCARRARPRVADIVEGKAPHQQRLGKIRLGAALVASTAALTTTCAGSCSAAPARVAARGRQPPALVVRSPSSRPQHVTATCCGTVSSPDGSGAAQPPRPPPPPPPLGSRSGRSPTPGSHQQHPLLHAGPAAPVNREAARPRRRHRVGGRPGFVRGHRRVSSGVGPVGHRARCALIDQWLRRLPRRLGRDRHPRAVFPTSFAELVRITGGTPADVSGSSANATPAGPLTRHVHALPSMCAR